MNFTHEQAAFVEKGERLIRRHRVKVFDPITGDAHSRAIRRLQAILRPFWNLSAAASQERVLRARWL